jgi:hypothetical protein
MDNWQRMALVILTVNKLRAILLALSLLFFLLPAHHCALGQAFQQPTADELSMTSDPKAPGADAVYFYREETSDDALHYHSLYARIKVLTEKGKELATVKIPYERGTFKVDGIKGRTIHSDGTIIPLNAKPSDLMEFKIGENQINQMVFTLPSVEVGSILEYKLDIRYEDNRVVSPMWDIQQPYFVHKAHYRFVPDPAGGHYITNSRGEALSRMMYTKVIGNGADIVRDQAGRYTLDLSDIPAIPNEDWAPPLDSINWHVYFYYTYAASGSEFWQKEGGHWQKEVERFAKVSNSLRDAANGLVSAGDSEEQKASKLYDAVMKIENTDFTRHKTLAERKAEKMKEAKTAEDIWNQKSGSSDDIALLYYALVRAVGLRAWPMQVVNRNRAIFDSSYLNIGQLDDFIVIVNINGKDVYLDPGERYCTFGQLHWKHNASGGLRFNADGKGTALAGTPANMYTSATTERIADITVDDSGAIKGSARFIMAGPEALHWRQLTLTNDTDEIKKQFNEELRGKLPDGVHTEFDHFLGLEEYNSKLIAIFNLSGNLGTMTGKRLFLPGLFFESQSRHPFVEQKSRFAPIDVHYAKLTQDTVTYHMPVGYAVESTPQSADTNWPQHAILRIKSSVSGSDVTIMRAFMYNYTYLASKDYNDLHDYYLKVAAADQQQVVLTHVANANPPKGN